MKVARTLLASKARPQDIPSNLGQIIFIETEDDFWKCLLGWKNSSKIAYQAIVLSVKGIKCTH